MTLACRWAAAVGAALAAALWVAAGGALAQVPTIPAPPDTSTTVPATPPSPDQSPPPSVPDPSRPPEPPDTTTPPGPPGSPKPTLARPTTTTTTVAKASSASSDAVPPAKQANLPPPELSLDLSQIGDLRRQARGKGPRPAQPDFGFAEELPFSPGAGRSSEEGPADEELGTHAEHVARVRSLGAVAGGLESLVVLGTVVWLLRQANPKRSGTAAGQPGTGR